MFQLDFCEQMTYVQGSFHRHFYGSLTIIKAKKYIITISYIE